MSGTGESRSTAASIPGRPATRRSIFMAGGAAALGTVLLGPTEMAIASDARSGTVDPSSPTTLTMGGAASGDPLYASWTHGNAVTVQSPENLVDPDWHTGWGADLLIKPATETWFHLPIPTPVIVSDARSKLVRVFLLFEVDPGMGAIRKVHVWDGVFNPQEFNDLDLTGEHRRGVDGFNTFTLDTPHTVRFGVSVSFLFVAAAGIDSPVPPAHLLVAAAGGDFSV